MISVIIPTLGTRVEELNRLFQSLSVQESQNFEAIVVSQDNHEKVEELLGAYTFPTKHVRLNRKGLSYSRNEGMKAVSGSIVTFSDDDCWYPPYAFKDAEAFLQNHPDKAGVCFQIFDPVTNVYYKNYAREPKDTLTLRELFQRSSIEFFISLDRVKKEDVFFDEDFGLGARYVSGEENIFLSHLHSLGHSVSYVNNVIVYHLKPSTDSRLNYKSFLSKGPLFRRISNLPVGFLMLTALFIKKYKYLEKPFPYYFASVREMISYKKRG
ncbi:glycosyltransferase family 2 protein [Metabacillus indicus]|uniref:glycosyltransferase family 2 protein n=1 Tax=Metabacillus indicus TaxID=246786 RepID=UPI00049309BE|nr:glycosyltransferase family 2 protein [Metabacillus indicus]KEZ48777.1 glycosyl transferase [Metabacillus indicus LMG 22858]